MADFATASKEAIATLLGYPLNDTELTYIAEAMGQVEDLADSTASTNAVTRIEGWLSQLATIQTNINTERDVEGTTMLPNLRYEGRRHVALIGNALGVEIRFDIFSSGAAES